ncbi:TPA: hypothetical protein KM432_002822 [Clostridioides difficile]|nr:hypothetical protein [Clostridioides difficile]MBY1659824.1 hypothetical protein [Clostridioides difficile]MCW0774027.1 hypothetical protein [Clostridioides difficile]HBE8718192.1 hypothetical protein [Clostridioides difficile]HBF8040777.1 hypothetical protein [Clostridioides difficile]
MNETDLDKIRKYPWDLKNAKTQTYEMCIESVKYDGELLKDVRWGELNLTKEQIYNLCLIAVKQNGKALKYVKLDVLSKGQVNKIYFEAVKENGLALYYVKNQIPEICREAVRSSGFALYYVKNQTPVICTEAVKRDGIALIHVKWNELEGKISKEQMLEICIEAVRENSLALEYVEWHMLSEVQIDKICREALKQDRHLIRYIKDKEKYLEEFDIKYLKKQGKAKEVIAIKEEGTWLFTIGCQYKITKETFIDRIYNGGRGFDLGKKINVHRQIYVDFLKEFE